MKRAWLRHHVLRVRASLSAAPTVRVAIASAASAMALLRESRVGRGRQKSAEAEDLLRSDQAVCPVAVHQLVAAQGQTLAAGSGPA